MISFYFLFLKYPIFNGDFPLKKPGAILAFALILEKSFTSVLVSPALSVKAVLGFFGAFASLLDAASSLAACLAACSYFKFK